MKIKLLTTLFTAALVALWLQRAVAEEFTPFLGMVTSDEINLRTDSTVSAPVIQKAQKGVYLQVIFQRYDWYKVKLPKTCPSYIKKTLIEPLSERAGKVIKENVNIRLGPSETTPVIGRAHRDEVVNILSLQGDWYRIEPVDSSFGWISKRFVEKATVAPAAKTAQAAQPPVSGEPARPVTISRKLTAEEQQVTMGSLITIEGKVKPYGRVFWRKATHKLTHQDEIFLLKGNRKTLDALNYHTVKVQGRLVDLESRYPIIEIEKIEALD